MSRFTKIDSMLISEAYSAQLLMESAPYMTIAEIQARLPHMTLSEAQVIEEMLGKFGKKLGEIGAGIGNLAGAAGRGIKAAGQAAGSAAANVGSGVTSSARTLGKNVQDMYTSGVESKQAQNAIENARELTQELIDLVVQAQKQGLVKAQKAIEDMTISEIVDELETAKKSASTFKSAANRAGYTGGVGTAFKLGSGQLNQQPFKATP
jgi:hypothetical protein